MNKIFKVRMKTWLWCSDLLKITGMEKILSRFYTLYICKTHTFRNLCGDDGEEVSSLLYEPIRSVRIMSCKQLRLFNSFNWIQQW